MNKIKCCKFGGCYCCSCRKSTTPGSAGGWIREKELNGHFYCYACYPTMVELYLCEQKIKDYENAKQQVKKN